MWRALVSVVVLVATTLVLAPPALGCSFAGPEPTEAEHVARADVVFEGVAGPHRDPTAGAPAQSSADPIFWTFYVDREVKGDVAPVQEVASPRSGASCGLIFDEGVRYRVFATYDGTVLTSRLGSGTRPAPLTASTTTTTTASPTTTRPPAARPARPVTGPRIALTG